MGHKSVTKNYLYNLTYQLLLIVLPIITVPYISRVLGALNIGIYSYTISIATYFITFGSLGIALYGQREIAYNQKDKKKYTYSFYEILFLKLITLSISLILFYFIFVNGNNDYTIYYKILLFEIIGNMFDISWFYQGLEEFKKVVIRNIVVKLLSIISIFIFVKTKDDLIIYFIIYVLSILIGNLSLWLSLGKYLDKINIKKINILKHLKSTLSLFIPQIAIQVYTLLDKTMIGVIILDKTEVGYYDQAEKIIKLLLTIITSMGTVMLPRVAATFIINDTKKIKQYIYNSFRFVAFLSIPLVLGICLISDAFVPIFFGEGYDRVSLLMKVISPIIILIGISNVTGNQYLLPTKRQKEFTISVICGALINFIINILLIPKYGALGASISTVIAEASVTVIQLVFVRKDWNYKEVLINSKNYIISGIIMSFTYLVLNRFLNDSIILLSLKAIISGLIYIISLLLLKDKIIIKFLNKKGDIK